MSRVQWGDSRSVMPVMGWVDFSEDIVEILTLASRGMSAHPETARILVDSVTERSADDLRTPFADG